METVVFAETLDNSQHSMRLISESLNCTYFSDSYKKCSFVNLTCIKRL
jgi:hypothetical protein